ncbi:MAG: hypothetical protein ACPGRC_10670 [Salibacteraceae bacterium]
MVFLILQTSFPTPIYMDKTMKKYTLVLTGIMLVFTTACGDANNKDQEPKGARSSLSEVVKKDKTVKLSQVLKGQWKTEGGEIFLNYSILKLYESYLSYTNLDRGNDFHFKKMK